MNRFETKFFLDYAQFRFLRERLVMLLNRDQHSTRNGAYPVLSAYFDTPSLTYFYQKINGDFQHTKIRLRRYATDLEHPGNAFLEAKLKFDQDQRKIRINLPFDTELLNPMNWYRLNDPKFQELLPWLPLEGLQHVCSVYYEREPFEAVVEGQKIRMNFDTKLVYLTPEERFVSRDIMETRTLLPENTVILEVKTDTPEMPEIIKDLLRSVNVDQIRVSKYAEAIVRLDEIYSFSEVFV